MREPLPHPPQAGRAPEASEPALDPEAEQEFDRLNIEGSVIRGPRRSLRRKGADFFLKRLRPHRRGFLPWMSGGTILAA